MPQIKVPLKQLVGLFVQSAQDTNLDMPSRRLAAQMTITVAHLQRIEAMIIKVVGVGTALEKKVDESLAAINEQLSAITGGAPPAPPAEGGNTGEPLSEEEEAAEMANRVHAETLAEVAAAQKNGGKAPVAPAPAAPVTPIRPTPDNAS